MLRTKFFRKKNSKKGFTLVEAICAVVILAIVFVGVLNAVAFSRQMVFTNNAREKASDRGQLVADEIISIATGFDPDDGSTPLTTVQANLVAAVDKAMNNVDDPQYDVIGRVANVGTFTNPTSFVPSDTDAAGCDIQYTISACTESFADTDVGAGAAKYVEQKGWNITVRVYYQRIGGNNTYDCATFTAFAPCYSLD